MPTAEYLEERARLREILPRGRFVEDEDGTCIVRARARRWAGDHLYIQSPGKIVGVFYVGRPARYLSRVGSLIVGHLRGEGEGILHLRWTAALAKVLPMFSRKRKVGGRDFVASAVGDGNDTQIASGAIAPPLPTPER